MKKQSFHTLPILLFLLTVTIIQAQQKQLNFTIDDSPIAKDVKNPFQKFVGEWALKDNSWTQNWGNGTETIKIPKHHTVSATINTDNSLLSIIDGPAPNGHIFWSYNPVTKEVQHLSSFGESRAGQGKGIVSENGDLKLKLTFQGEPAATYRQYSYHWINDDEYELKSIQFDINNQPTGLFYGGIFIRIKPITQNQMTTQIQVILSVLDDNEVSLSTKLNVYANDVVHMAPDSQFNDGKAALKTYLLEQEQYGYANMEHQILEVQPAGNFVIMRGQVIGTFHPSNGDKSFPFKTKNLFVFKWVNDQLKIWKVIYNQSPIN
ncbi:MAG: hypothetical protein AAGJ18_23705 [Bacteroidota bacterium]